MDYVSNNVLMPIVSIGTCILIGWILKPKTVIDEVEKTGIKMVRKGLYTVMVKCVAPILLFLLLIFFTGCSLNEQKRCDANNHSTNKG